MTLVENSDISNPDNLTFRRGIKMIRLLFGYLHPDNPGNSW